MIEFHFNGNQPARNYFMKNTGIAYDIFKILLTEYVACESVKDTHKTQEIDGLITQSFKISDQFIARAEPEQVAQTPPEPQPTKPEPKK